jgi:hypothetical protein
LFGEVRVSLHGDDGTELPEDDTWWMQLLYRMGLEDRGRLNVLVQPRVDDVVTGLADCVRGSAAGSADGKSGSTKGTRTRESDAGARGSGTRRPKRREIVEVAGRLEKQYGHLSPPPLWTAWFQAVHGDELRKIREHFAREAR